MKKNQKSHARALSMFVAAVVATLGLSAPASAKSFHLQYTFHCRHGRTTILRVASNSNCPMHFHHVGKIVVKRISTAATSTTLTATPDSPSTTLVVSPSTTTTTGTNSTVNERLSSDSRQNVFQRARK